MKVRSVLVASLLFPLLILITPLSRAESLADLTPQGPGNHILGLDISRYQHSKSKPINFAAMYESGVRFLWINGGNTLAAPDELAFKYYRSDRIGAQQNNIFTGFYYYVHLPNTVKKSVIVANARNQANKVLARINSQGGLNQLDLPVAIDLERTCTQEGKHHFCTHHMSKKNISIWLQTWLKTVEGGTGRAPIIYSYLSFLGASIGNFPGLADYPAWVATARINPKTSQPTLPHGKCSSNVWTTAGCHLHWTFWQYSSGGIGARYGLQSGPVDMDIFNGDSAKFLSLTTYPQTPTAPEGPIPAATPVPTS